MMKQGLSRYLTKTIGEPPSDLDTTPVAAEQPYTAETVAGELLPPGMDEIFNDEGITFDGPVDTSIMGRIRHHKRILIIAGCAVCVAASAVYAALGIWLYLSIGEQNSAKHDEPVAFLNMQETDKIHAGTREVLKNINLVQQQGEKMVRDMLAQASKPAGLGKDAKASAMDGKTLAGLPVNAPLPANDKLAMAGIQGTLAEITGRPDPFEPLVQPVSTETSASTEATAPVEVDVVTFLQYAGFIGDINTKDKVAIIKMNDPALGAKTLIKKTGESFMVDGQKVVLKAISKASLQLLVKGRTRQLSLNSYTEKTGSASGGSGSSSSGSTNTPSTGGSATTAGSGASAAGASTLGNIAKVAADSAASKSTSISSNGPNVQLQEH